MPSAIVSKIRGEEVGDSFKKTHTTKNFTAEKNS